MDRRAFLGAVAGVAGVVAVSIPIVRALAAAPQATRAKTEWTRILGAEQLTQAPLDKTGKPLAVTVERQEPDRWALRTVHMTVFVVRTGEAIGALKVFSGVCPHAGCTVGFDSDKGEFLCPCHKAEFAVDGRALDGPVPRGLDALPVKFDANGLHAQLIHYRLNIAEQVEV